MKKTPHLKMPQKVHTSLNIIADLLSEASPNQKTDPKSAWARARSVSNLTDKQRKLFAKHTNIVIEAVWDHII